MSTSVAHLFPSNPIVVLMSVALDCPLESDELPVAAQQAEVRVNRRFPRTVRAADGTQFDLDERAVTVRQAGGDGELRPAR